MIDLSKVSGLPMELDEKTFKLKLNPPLNHVIPSVRKYEDLKAVLMDPEAKPTRDENEVYYMYRDIFLPEDEELIRNNKVRYDITVIPAAMYGNEFIKTVGHFHSVIPGDEYEYPEIYEVLHGQALFLIQKMEDNDPSKIKSVMAIKAGVGDKVIYPPNYGHMIANIGNTVLVTANWVSSEYTADYKSIAAEHGMAYYVIKGTDKQFEIIPNTHYKYLPEIKFAQGHMNTTLGFTIDEPMYTTGTKRPAKLEFLNDPEKYMIELSSITS